MKLEKSEYAAFYSNYVNSCPDVNIVTNLTISHNEAMNLLKDISEEKAKHAYAEGKWTIKELVQHVIDSERVFAYRAMCIARGETTALPGFDENIYAENSLANTRTIKSMINEFNNVRLSTIDLYNSFNTDTLTNLGNANGSPISVRALGFITAGHCMHHMNILKERYL